jgi:hypothetical protein
VKVGDTVRIEKLSSTSIVDAASITLLLPTANEQSDYLLTSFLHNALGMAFPTLSKPTRYASLTISSVQPVDIFDPGRRSLFHSTEGTEALSY